MRRMREPKEFSSFDRQIEIICEKIAIRDKDEAKEALKKIGYFQLMGGYKSLFRIPGTKKYKEGTSFEEIVSLYEFDVELRELFFRYLLQIERNLRSLMSYYYTETYGAAQKEYLNQKSYDITKKNKHTVERLIATLERAANTQDYAYINYYREQYGDIPLWVLSNVLTFGNLSKMFRVFPRISAVAEIESF